MFLNACLRLKLVTTGCLTYYFCCVWYYWILIFSLLIWYSLVIFFRLAGLWLPGTCLFCAELIYGLCGLHFWWACHCYYLLNNFILSIKLVDSIKNELGCSRVYSIQPQLNDFQLRGLFYYIISISFYFLHLAPWLRQRLGKTRKNYLLWFVVFADHLEDRKSWQWSLIIHYCRQAQRPLSGYGNITSASPGRCCSTIGTFCQYWRLYKLVIFGNCDWQCRYGKNGHSVKKTLNWINYSESTLQVQTLGFWALTICPVSETSMSIMAPIPTWVELSFE